MLPSFQFSRFHQILPYVVNFLTHDFLQALLEYEKYRMQCGELPFFEYDMSIPKAENQVTFVQNSKARPSRMRVELHNLTKLSFHKVQNHFVNIENNVTTAAQGLWMIAQFKS